MAFLWEGRSGLLLQPPIELSLKSHRRLEKASCNVHTLRDVGPVMEVAPHIPVRMAVVDDEVIAAVSLCWISQFETSDRSGGGQ